MAKKLDADLVLATDPDADRLGVYVKDSKSGEYIPLTGNMSGSLLCEYVLSQKAAKNAIPEDGEVVKSIVTTNLVDAVADYYHCKLVECLTGFKWIGKQILKEEQTGKGHYMFGLEESYGCLIGTSARDYKDAVKAIGLKGIEGLAKIQNIMETLRKEAPAKVGEYDVVSARDYKLDTIKDMKTGAVTETGLPASNVLYYDLNDGAWVCVRPSGTEPKIKFYYGVKGTSLEDADKKSAELGEALMAMVDKML